MPKPKAVFISAGSGVAEKLEVGPHPLSGTSDSALHVAYTTGRGTMYECSAEDFLRSAAAEACQGKVQLIFTSPPFPLNRKKKYGNLQGKAYVDWLASFAPILKNLLKANGSIVMEMGNAWEPGKPVMSTLALRALLAFLDAGELFLCEQFICYNPARLPTPAQWVNVERIRVKDAFTHVWWMAKAPRPKANNRRVLTQYSEAMLRLLSSKKYNSGKRPSEHNIGRSSFLRDNAGAIPSNVLRLANTNAKDHYLSYCRERSARPHPARMHPGLAEFFVKFLTDPRDLVMDPFAGSNTTGAVAESLKRRWLCVEKSRDYIAGSMARFARDQWGKPR
jgi:hypothetical protein